jgi:hypothetical protein
MKDTPIKTKSYAFAIRIVRLFQWMCKERRNSFASSPPQLRPFVRKPVPCRKPPTSFDPDSLYASLIPNS